uniref:G-protein coupled receptors family 1 profile domain-containing protein n=1 Tax=Biomphalaria glabrata TaxID=6526 RepID=A0A2C9M6I5_BIOGL
MNLDIETKNDTVDQEERGHNFGQSLMSLSEREIYDIINLNVIIQLISLYGIISNIITIAVFCKQGFHTTVNISLTGLAVSDLCSLLVTQWYIVCFNPYFVNSGIPMLPAEVQHLTAGVPHLCFSRITGWITTYITAERCLSIYAPLQVKVIITPKKSAVIISFIYVITIMTLAPEYLTLYIGWKFEMSRNVTLLGLIHTVGTSDINGLSFLLYAFHMLVAFTAVVTLTSTLVIKLKQNTKWRQSLSNAVESSHISTRDKKSVTMAIVIATVMILLFTPSVFITVTSFIVSDFNIDGRFSNLFLVVWSFGLMFEVINSSLCLVLYYVMSSKFRKTFHDLFPVCRCLEHRFVTCQTNKIH